MIVARAVGLGAISGMRSLSGPAFLSRAASKGHVSLDGTALAFLGSPLLSKALALLELGELIGDKLPVAPSRTATLPLVGRAVSGGLVGAALFASEDRRTATGAILGASAAIAAAFVGERLRALAGKRTELPDPLVALVEDTIVLLAGFGSLNVNTGS
ncbi:hypothetical protein Rxycam_01052 [Rubrobacter xylanophilus DSM 9941]|uniref:DUF4126 family protein n=1 Tax=Rubrobacter xylanophilus TaxID=49319 RepID=UPI001C63F989|nr:DUF4126 family protein [Rubrobacter xylanophilus]QYJ15237.1 hypothetical protein Rxycam_01052 [Rubrobacter xylanophilus DSM 9941]